MVTSIDGKMCYFHHLFMEIVIVSGSVVWKGHSIYTFIYTQAARKAVVCKANTHTHRNTLRLAASAHTSRSQIPDVATYGAVMKSLDEALD